MDGDVCDGVPMEEGKQRENELLEGKPGPSAIMDTVVSDTVADPDYKQPIIHHNPWAANSAQDFCFYCCPECPFRSSLMSPFEEHAVENHPLVRIGALISLKYDSISKY